MNNQKHNTYIGIIVIIALLASATWLASRPQNIGNRNTSALFSSDTRNLPDAVPMQTVELKDGDTYELTAQQIKKNINGQEIKMLGYNGSVPGPLIKVKQGSEITIHFTNNTDVETTLHSHGVRVDNAFDGTPHMTQDAIPVNGSFTYRLKFPDAGMYWYHPHVREDYSQELGLYGNFLVEGKDTAHWSPANREVPIILDDILLEQGKIAPFAKDNTSHTLMGRFGNTMLINGETSIDLQARPGEVVRFFITNTANTRVFTFSIPGARMKLVGSDGGAYEKEMFVDSVTISPSERATIDVLFESMGTYPVQHNTPQKTYPLGTITVDGATATPSYATQFVTPRTHTATQSEIATLRPLLTKVADKALTIGIAMGMMNMTEQGNSPMDHSQHGMQSGSMMMSSGNPIEWEDDMPAMNSASTTETVQWQLIDQATRKTNMDIDWTFKRGDKVKIQITNSANSMHPMQHPIHIHGQRFLITSTNGIPNDNLAWKDTALVQTGDTVELLVDMTNPGTWMLHCHIAEHLESGMMMPFIVTP